MYAEIHADATQVWPFLVKYIMEVAPDANAAKISRKAKPSNTERQRRNRRASK